MEPIAKTRRILDKKKEITWHNQKYIYKYNTEVGNNAILNNTSILIQAMPLEDKDTDNKEMLFNSDALQSALYNYDQSNCDARTLFKALKKYIRATEISQEELIRKLDNAFNILTAPQLTKSEKQKIADAYVSIKLQEEEQSNISSEDLAQDCLYSKLQKIRLNKINEQLLKLEIEPFQDSNQYSHLKLINRLQRLAELNTFKEQIVQFNNSLQKQAYPADIIRIENAIVEKVSEGNSSAIAEYLLFFNQENSNISLYEIKEYLQAQCSKEQDPDYWDKKICDLLDIYLNFQSSEGKDIKILEKKICLWLHSDCDMPVKEQEWLDYIFLNSIEEDQNDTSFNTALKEFRLRNAPLTREIKAKVLKVLDTYLTTNINIDLELTENNNGDYHIQSLTINRGKAIKDKGSKDSNCGNHVIPITTILQSIAHHLVNKPFEESTFGKLVNIYGVDKKLNDTFNCLKEYITDAYKEKQEIPHYEHASVALQQTIIKRSIAFCAMQLDKAELIFHKIKSHTEYTKEGGKVKALNDKIKRLISTPSIELSRFQEELKQLLKNYAETIDLNNSSMSNQELCHNINAARNVFKIILNAIELTDHNEKLIYTTLKRKVTNTDKDLEYAFKEEYKTFRDDEILNQENFGKTILRYSSLPNEQSEIFFRVWEEYIVSYNNIDIFSERTSSENDTESIKNSEQSETESEETSEWENEKERVSGYTPENIGIILKEITKKQFINIKIYEENIEKNREDLKKSLNLNIANDKWDSNEQNISKFYIIVEKTVEGFINKAVLIGVLLDSSMSTTAKIISIIGENCGFKVYSILQDIGIACSGLDNTLSLRIKDLSINHISITQFIEYAKLVVMNSPLHSITKEDIETISANSNKTTYEMQHNQILSAWYSKGQEMVDLEIDNKRISNTEKIEDYPKEKIQRLDDTDNTSIYDNSQQCKTIDSCISDDSSIYDSSMIGSNESCAEIANLVP